MSLARLPRAACLLRGSHFRHGSALYSSAAVPAPVAPAAALLVVGDEILAGSITDVNTPWLAKLLHSRGVDLVRVEFVPDQADDIAATALRLRQRVGPSGFVGPAGPAPAHCGADEDLVCQAGHGAERSQAANGHPAKPSRGAAHPGHL
ncbi:MoCF_biosynth domain-containing protein, partial [Haematococcus lacustris]